MQEQKVIHDVAFRVPNNRTGNKFIKDCRKYVNRAKYSRVLARPRSGTRTQWGETEREGCKSFAVYLSHSQAQIDANYARQARRDKLHYDNYIGRFEHDKMVHKLREELSTTHRENFDNLIEMQRKIVSSKREILTLRIVALALAAFSMFSTIAFIIKG